MTVLTWVIRLVIFFFLVVFAVQNTVPVRLSLLLYQVEAAPLVIVLLAFFAAGVVIGALSLVGALYRQRREISRLRKQVDKLPQESPPVL
ncbi:MAG: LapA family protein [Betaproteobacteria bacterium]|nr:LapA family protein [Betaproteobacteria bacterium]MCL2886168.1 LapA family protein [Betaproteobacteria bacterium]